MGKLPCVLPLLHPQTGEPSATGTGKGRCCKHSEATSQPSLCAEQPKPPRLLSSYRHNKCSQDKNVPTDSGFYTVSPGSPNTPPMSLPPGLAPCFSPPKCLPPLCGRAFFLIQSCQLPVPNTAVVLTIVPLMGLVVPGKG